LVVGPAAFCPCSIGLEGQGWGPLRKGLLGWQAHRALAAALPPEPTSRCTSSCHPSSARGAPARARAPPRSRGPRDALKTIAFRARRVAANICDANAVLVGYFWRLPSSSPLVHVRVPPKPVLFDQLGQHLARVLSVACLSLA